MNKEFVDLLKTSKKIAVISHINPDADALCSSFAFKNIVKNNYDYKYVDVFMDGNIGSLYDPILRDEVINPNPYNSYDLAVVLDCPNIDRTGKYAELIRNTKKIVNIDHHETNIKFGDLNFVSAKSSSTCELIYLISKACGYDISNVTAKELYQGIITDTNCFQSGTMNKRTHMVISELLGYKFDAQAIKEYYFNNNSREKLKLLSKALLSMRFYCDEKFITMKLPYDLFSKLGSNFEDTLGIVDEGINVEGAEGSAILIETEPENVYVSLRSKGRLNVGEVAIGFNGGGSQKMAAFQAKGDLKEIEKNLVQTVLPKLEGIERDDDNIIF